ncbi:MAG: ABC transporter ATP-binding protein [Patescibacteria group bacterium]
MFLKNNKYISFIKLCYRGFSKYKLQISILTILGFLSASLEGIGINALIPLFSFVTGEAGGDDFISQTIKKSFSYFHIEFRLKYLLIFVCLLFVFKAIVLVWSEYIRVKITSDYEEKIRSNLFNKFLEANWSYLLKQKLGHLETVLMTNVQTSSAVLSYISSFLIIISSLIVYLLVAINISLYITLVSVVLSGLLFFIFKPFFSKIRTFAYSQEKINRRVAHHINENIVGMKTVKVMSASSRVGEMGKEYFKLVKNIKIKVNLLQLVTGSLMQPASIVFICIIFSFSYKSSNFNLASFIAVVYLVKQIFSYTELLQKKILSFSASIPYFKSILNYEEEALRHKEVNTGHKKFKFNDSLDFDKVNFGYNNGKNVLSDVNFSIKKGEMVGLIGPSGAGKTTIVDLILRLFDPTEGKILIDGGDIKDLDIKDWRKNIGYVSQDIFLQNDTIFNNIKFYNNDISEQDIIEGAKTASIYDFIESLPDKFNTVIGERGVLLSGGQRQRIIIARILARKPKLLILDEATSALDNESEVQIQNVINKLKGKITVLAIAHRLSTLINSDKLLVIDKGEIIEQGDPQELLKDKESYFYKVYNIRK